ncbi:(2Fe-2S)-binding protein [Fimbriiglobus ruber]|uniref:(2Fe-2S)-binding protein n=1 Tax=Fimbriiglobus ruber TaxID=1908690 RepID=UPI003B84A599
MPLIPVDQVATRDCPDPCAGPCSGCPDRIVCKCLRVTEGEIVDAIASGAHTLPALRRATQAGTGCNCCLGQLREYLATYATSPSFSSSTLICSER